MKKSFYLIAIPLLNLTSGCTMIYNDQIRIPEEIIYRGKIDNDDILLYQNMFRNTLSYSEIMQIKRSDGKKINYIGSHKTSKLDFIEEGGLFGKRRNFGVLSEEEKEEHQSKYGAYSEKIRERIFIDN